MYEWYVDYVHVELSLLSPDKSFHLFLQDCAIEHYYTTRCRHALQKCITVIQISFLISNEFLENQWLR